MYRRQRLAELNRLFKLETLRLDELKTQYRLAVKRLNNRLVAIYENDQPSTLDFVLGSASIDEALDMVDFVNMIGAEDKKIAAEVKHSKLEMQAQRAQTKRVRLKVHGDERALAARAAQEQEARDALVGARNDLAQTKSEQATNLSKLSAQDQALADEIAQEQASSAALAAAIRAAQARAQANPGRDRDPVLRRPDLAGERAGHEPVRAALGKLPQGIDIGAPTGRRSRRPQAARSSTAGGSPATAISSCSTTAATSRRRTPTSRRSRLVRPTRRAGADDRLRRLHRALLRAAPPLRGAHRRVARRPAWVSLATQGRTSASTGRRSGR
jgi:hypothetical protein